MEPFGSYERNWTEEEKEKVIFNAKKSRIFLSHQHIFHRN